MLGQDFDGLQEEEKKEKWRNTKIGQLIII